MRRSILEYDTVRLDTKHDCVEIIDQTLLPGTIETKRLFTEKQIWNAIYHLQVRGAPAIGVTAALGLYVLMSRSEAKSYEEFMNEMWEKIDYLNSSRPTAVNLSWALKRMETHIKEFAQNECREIESDGAFDKSRLVAEMKAEALRIQSEDIAVCRKIGEYGVKLIKNGDGLLTHCNAGQLATCKYGTATAPFYLAHEKRMNIRVYCDETRPLLQGARLTAFELNSAGIDTTLLCDNMSASLMRSGAINAVFVGCDRVAANGDTANKIGTSAVAIIAKRYNVPFYVCAPTSTIDIDTPSGNEIKIEQRKPEEVTSMWYEEPMAPEGIKVYNPAFDVTDNELITGIITEYGILEPPYDMAIQKLFETKVKL